MGGNAVECDLSQINGSHIFSEKAEEIISSAFFIEINIQSLYPIVYYPLMQ
jgi:hypothetical protein